MTFGASQSTRYHDSEPQCLQTASSKNTSFRSTRHTGTPFNSTSSSHGKSINKLEFKKAPSRGPLFGAHTKNSTSFMSQPMSKKLSSESPLSGKHTDNNQSDTSTANCPWKKNQPVQHATFGLGIITAVEEKNSLVVHVTVQFKTGTKKLDARFIKPI
jgi:hypothetical protein